MTPGIIYLIIGFVLYLYCYLTHGRHDRPDNHLFHLFMFGSYVLIWPLILVVGFAARDK